MAQKTNPKGFRLLTIQKHLSNFYSDKISYSSIIEDDYKIRAQFMDLCDKYFILSSIKISRTQKTIYKSEFINIKINFLYPRKWQADNFILSFFSCFYANENYKNKYKKLLDLERNFKTKLKICQQNYALFVFKRYVQKFAHILNLKNKSMYSISIKLINNLLEDAALISKYVLCEIKKRINISRIISNLFKRAKSLQIAGLKIQLSGRLEGKEMARSKWEKHGNLPLHTLKLRIDYSQEFINTPQGIISVKIWLFKN